MRFLVTGGAGFIGSHLVEALLHGGHRVRVLDDFSTGKYENLDFPRPGAALEIIEGDIRDSGVVRHAMRDVDGAFHEAALVSVPRSIEEPELSLAINAGGTLNVFEAARRTGVRRVVCASSAAVYGDSDRLPLAESTPLRPTSPYGLDKLYLEHLGALYASLHGLEAVALRYFNVFGPRQDPTSPYSGVISIFVDRLRRGEAPTIYGDGEQTRDFVYVGDVVRANLAAMGGLTRGFQALNVGAGRRVSLNALLSELAAVLGVTARATHAAARPGDIRDSQADIANIRAALGYTPRWSLREGLAALVGRVSPATDGRAETTHVL